MNAARIEFDYIAIDTNAWIAAIAGDPIRDLTDLIQDFDDALRESTSLRLPSVELFITARAGTDWQSADHAVITSADGGGIVNLTDDIIIYRYTDPEHGDVALIATDDHGFSSQFTAYHDTCHDSADWYDFHDVEIHCPDGHGWTLRHGELIDTGGTCHRIEDVFPTRDVLTLDTDPDSPTYDEHRILCPTCGRPCELATPQLN